MRRAIPLVIEPLTLQHATPEDLYSAFAQKVTSTGKDLRAFTDAYDDPTYREYLKTAQESKTTDADGIRPWLISEHPDWMEIKKEEVEEDMNRMSGKSGVSGTASVPQDVQQMLEHFRERYEGIHINHSGTAASDKFQVRALTGLQDPRR